MATAPSSTSFHQDDFLIQVPIFFGWLIAFAMVIWAIGFQFVVPIVVCLYMRRKGKMGWWKCMMSTGLALAFIVLVLGRAFQVNWPIGTLLEAFDR